VLSKNDSAFSMMVHGGGKRRLVVIFGVGLLLGAIYFGVLTILKVEVPQRIIANERPTGVRGKVLEVIGLVGLWGSAAAFALGAGWMIAEILTLW
jgi:hypothetical protein